MIVPRVAKFGDFGETGPEPHGTTAKAIMSFSNEERFGDSEVMATTMTVRPGVNNGEPSIILVEQSQNLDTSWKPHGGDSGLINTAQEVLEHSA